MTSGPGLTKRDTHHAIHEAAFAEAEELTRLLRRVARTDDSARALKLAGVLIEHWQTRTLRHAEAEEQGWYRDLARERPELRLAIIQLTRDHDLLRMLLDEIERIVAARGWVAGIVERFEAMLLLNAIHSREEERRLLGGETAQYGSFQHEGHEDLTKDATGLLNLANTEAIADDLPLVIAYPLLYRQGIERLGEHGLHPGDLRLTVRSSLTAGGPHLRAEFGDGFAEHLELPLPDGADPDAVGDVFDAIADACERTVRADYYEAMRMTEPGTPGIPGTRGGQRARFNLTIIERPKDRAR